MENEPIKTADTAIETTADKHVDKTDYKALYEATLRERDAKNAKINGLEADLKGYKEKEKAAEEKAREQLPQEEQIRIAMEEKDKEVAALNAKLNRMEINNEFASRGYAESEYSELAEILASGNDVDGAKKYSHRVDIAKKLLDFVDSVKSKATESAKIGALRDGIVYPNGNAAEKKNDFQRYQEQKIKNDHTGRVELK